MFVLFGILNKPFFRKPVSVCKGSDSVFFLKNFKLYKAFVGKDLNLRRKAENIELPLRKPIPQNVKDKVWKRDGGVCVQCGSNKNLEFDGLGDFE